MEDKNTDTAGILKRDVVLTLKGAGKTFGIPEGVEVIYPGQYYFRNGTHFILYSESSDDAGTVIDTSCILKLNPERIEIVKRGAVSTCMTFIPGDSNTSVYQTSVGELLVGTDVRELKLSEGIHRLNAELDYSISINSEYSEECHLSITVTD